MSVFDGSRLAPVRGSTHDLFMGPSTGDPVADLILTGEARTVDEAEELYLDRHLDDIVRLVESPLSEAEFRSHPLVALLLARGSRGWEDSIR